MRKKERSQDEQSFTTAEKIYEPTKTERALLDVMLDPSNRLKNVSEICSLVPCSRPSYYEAFKKPEFAKLYREESFEMVRRAVAPVLNSVVRQAARGSHNHAKIILGMADIYHERKEISGPNGSAVPVEFNDIQRSARIAAILAEAKKRAGK